MSFITTPDGTELYVKDWGRGQPIVFNHAYSLNGDAFEDQMFFLASRGYRCIVHDRRGHGRSSQPWQGYDIDTFADDLHEVMRALDLSNAILVGHSTGGAVVARYIGRHGTRRIAKVALLGSVTPLIAASASNAQGVPGEVFDGFREAVLANRAKFMRELAIVYFGANRADAGISTDLLELSWNQDMMSSLPAAYFSIKAYSETDTTEDLRKIDVPTLILHGDDDQIAPVRNAYLSAKLVPNSTLKIYSGAPHALIATEKSMVNEDLLNFIESVGQEPAPGDQEISSIVSPLAIF